MGVVSDSAGSTSSWFKAPVGATIDSCAHARYTNFNLHNFYTLLIIVNQDLDHWLFSVTFGNLGSKYTGCARRQERISWWLCVQYTGCWQKCIWTHPDGQDPIYCMMGLMLPTYYLQLRYSISQGKVCMKSCDFSCTCTGWTNSFSGENTWSIQGCDDDVHYCNPKLLAFWWTIINV